MVNNATNVPGNAVQFPPVIKCTGLTIADREGLLLLCRRRRRQFSHAAAADENRPARRRPKRVKRRRRLYCHQGTGLLLGWIPRRRITNVVE